MEPDWILRHTIFPLPRLNPLRSSQNPRPSAGFLIKLILTGTNQLRWWGWCHRWAGLQMLALSPWWPVLPEGFQLLRYWLPWLWCWWEQSKKTRRKMERNLNCLGINHCDTHAPVLTSRLWGRSIKYIPPPEMLYPASVSCQIVRLVVRKSFKLSPAVLRLGRPSLGLSGSGNFLP